MRAGATCCKLTVRIPRSSAGYVHVPELEEVGYGEFHRYYLVESQKDGLILDIRWNEGTPAG